eukprot:3854100-Prymnesium_polylepis.1
MGDSRARNTPGNTAIMSYYFCSTDEISKFPWKGQLISTVNFRYFETTAPLPKRTTILKLLPLHTTTKGYGLYGARVQCTALTPRLPGVPPMLPHAMAVESDHDAALR